MLLIILLLLFLQLGAIELKWCQSNWISETFIHFNASEIVGKSLAYKSRIIYNCQRVKKLNILSNTKIYSFWCEAFARILWKRVINLQPSEFSYAFTIFPYNRTYDAYNVKVNIVRQPKSLTHGSSYIILKCT